MVKGRIKRFHLALGVKVGNLYQFPQSKIDPCSDRWLSNVGNTCPVGLRASIRWLFIALNFAFEIAKKNAQFSTQLLELAP